MPVAIEKRTKDNLRSRKIEEFEILEKQLKKQVDYYRHEYERLGALLENAPVIVCMADINGKTTYINTKFEEVTGYSRDEVVGKLWFKLGIVTASNTRLLLKRTAQKLMGKPPSSMEIKIRRKTGEYRWVSGIGQLIKENGKAVGFQITANDITEMVIARKALTESEHKFRKLADQSPNMIVIRKKNRIVYANRKCEEITGCSIQELCDDHFDMAKMIAPECNSTIKESKTRHERGKEVPPWECTLISRAGKRIDALVYTNLIDFEGKRAVLATVIDITERRKAEEVVLRAAEEWRTTFDSITDLVSIHDENGKIVRANKAFASVLKLKPQDVVGKKCCQLVHGTNKPPTNCPRLKTLKSKNPTMEEIYEPRLGMHLQILTSPLNESIEEDKGISIVHVARDISERKLAEEQRREGVEKLLDTMEATIEAIATTAEIRDPYTADHQRRVSQLACAIAKDLGLSENQVQGIRLTGLVHDIGKIYIPAEILSKPGNLIDIERDMIKMHPKIGHDILKRVDFPWPIAETVMQHHERIDGSGYPNGISGEDILIEAKVLAVADVVEAMSSHRPYRPSLSLKKALEEISSKSGICYDSRVVESCIKLFTTGLFKFH